MIRGRLPGARETSSGPHASSRTRFAWVHFFRTRLARETRVRSAVLVTTTSARTGSRAAASRTTRSDAEQGSVALYLAVFMTALMVMAGLVVDGGAALAARGRAEDLAQQAARAGADALAPVSLRTANPDGLAIDPVAAERAARAVLDAGGASGAVTIAGLDVTVTARVPRHAAVLSAVGITDLSGEATATATVLHGAAVEDR